MALDYVKTSQAIAEGVGGVENIASATCCMTRLRLVLKDESKANDAEVGKIKGVKSVIKQGGQYQVVIGNEVSNLFKEFRKLGSFDEKGGGAPEKAGGNPLQRLFGFVSGCMTPLLPAMLGCGMLKVVLVLLTTFAGLDSSSSTYILLFSFADAFFMFLPIFLGVTIAKKMGGSTVLFMVVGAALCYPQLNALMGGGISELGTVFGMPCTYMFGIPVLCAAYTSSVLPMLLMAPVMKWAEDFADRVSPNVLKSFLKPLLFLMICIPLSLYILGPLGNVLGNLLSGVFLSMYNKVPWLTVGVLSALMPFIVMTGMHYALIPLCFNNLAILGFDVIVLVTMFCSNLAQGAAALGVAARTRDTDIKSEGVACGISAIVAGVTEPAMYGINFRFMTPMIGAVLGAGVGGLFCGITGVKGYSMGGSPSILSLMTFVGGDGNPFHSVIFGAISAAIICAIAFAVSFVLFKDSGAAGAPAGVEAGAGDEAPQLSGNPNEISSPIVGKVIPLEEVPDEAFSSGAMGVGFGVIPAVGKVYAPFDGKCQMVFETRHALGLVSENGVEILIHVGLETVNLEGKPFKAHVSSGDSIRRGQLLLEFDIDAIKAAGCRIETPILVTNAEDLNGVKVQDNKIVIGG